MKKATKQSRKTQRRKDRQALEARKRARRRDVFHVGTGPNMFGCAAFALAMGMASPAFKTRID